MCFEALPILSHARCGTIFMERWLKSRVQGPSSVFSIFKSWQLTAQLVRGFRRSGDFGTCGARLGAKPEHAGLCLAASDWPRMRNQPAAYVGNLIMGWLEQLFWYVPPHTARMLFNVPVESHELCLYPSAQPATQAPEALPNSK